METVVRTARTVEEAEELAMKELGVDRNEVEVEVLSKGKPGFLGIGAEVARVRVTRRGADDGQGIEAGATGVVAVAPEPGPAGATAGDLSDATNETDEPTTSATAPKAEDGGEGAIAGLGLTALNNILSTAGVNVTCAIRSANDPNVGGPIIDLAGDDSGLLIGRRGQTLQSLQFIVNMIVRKEFGEGVRVSLDVEGYRQRREESLRDMATKVAERVSQTGRSITLEPMSAADRRIIHMSLAENASVSTESAGFGEERKVTIMPKR